MNIICIVGPTGVGKTKLSIELAKKLNGEIINADSTQVYKELNVATAKIKKNEMDGIIHHLIDIKEITDDYTVYDFQKDGRRIIDEIINKGKTPIIVGGTGLYIKALLYDYKFEEEKINSNYDDISTEQLYKKLLEVDPDTDIHQNNRKRIIRSLNYFEHNNSPMSKKEKTQNILYKTKFIGLTTKRDKLYDIINNRVDQMVKEGLIDEAKNIYVKNIRSKAVMTPIGYKELFDYFDGLCSLEDSINLIKQRSRRYAKRQYTWFNNQMDITWFDVDYDNFNKTITEVLNYIERGKR